MLKGLTAVFCQDFLSLAPSRWPDGLVSVRGPEVAPSTCLCTLDAALWKEGRLCGMIVSREVLQKINAETSLWDLNSSLVFFFSLGMQHREC